MKRMRWEINCHGSPNIWIYYSDCLSVFVWWWFQKFLLCDDCCCRRFVSGYRWCWNWRTCFHSPLVMSWIMFWFLVVVNEHEVGCLHTSSEKSHSCVGIHVQFYKIRQSQQLLLEFCILYWTAKHNTVKCQYNEIMWTTKINVLQLNFVVVKK
jgi:hypothetical protein